jgi:hypothetical protein
MPAHEDSLAPDERALVAAFERVTYGSESRQEALAGCGIDAGGD